MQLLRLRKELAAQRARGAFACPHRFFFSISLSHAHSHARTHMHAHTRTKSHTHSCRDLDEHAVVSRVMRKDNYLIALINKGVLRLAPPPLLPALTAILQGTAGAPGQG